MFLLTDDAMRQGQRHIQDFIDKENPQKKFYIISGKLNETAALVEAEDLLDEKQIYKSSDNADDIRVKQISGLNEIPFPEKK